MKKRSEKARLCWFLIVLIKMTLTRHTFEEAAASATLIDALQYQIYYYTATCSASSGRLTDRFCVNYFRHSA